MAGGSKLVGGRSSQAPSPSPSPLVGNNKSAGDEAIAEHGLSSHSLLIPGAKQPGGEMGGVSE